MKYGGCTHARVMVAAISGVFALIVFAQRAAQAGHESPFYPSFYPQEIRIETLDPAIAAADWPKARVHAYVGDGLFAGAQAPADAVAVETLRSYLVLTFDGAAGRFGAGNNHTQNRCAVARRIIQALAPRGAGYVFHPYPVTPYHADYLQQFDLAQRAQTQYAAPASDMTTGPTLQIRAKEPLAQTLLPAAWRAIAAEWDATLEEIDISQLSAADRAWLGGWVRPPWDKQGWFQAHLLYAGRLQGSAAKKSADAVYRRLVNGDYRALTDRKSTRLNSSHIQKSRMPSSA